MAIEEFGESLLAQQRGQMREQRKRIEKAQKQGQLISLATMGVKIGNKFLEDRTNSFLNNEAVLAEKAQYRSAANNAEAIFKEQQAIDASGLSAEDYFFKTYRDPFEARAREVVPFEQVGKAGAYNAVISKEARKLAEQRAAAHREGLTFAEKVVDEEDFEAMMSLNARKARPTNVFGALTQGAERMFKGKTKDQFDSEALAAIRNSDMAMNIDQMNQFEKRYEKTKDVVGSYDFAKLVVPDAPEDEKFLTEVKTDVKGVGSNIIEVTTTKKTNRNTGASTESVTTTSQRLEDKTPQELEAAALKIAKDAFDYAKDSRDALTTEGYSLFVAEVKDTLGIDITNPMTLEEHVEIGKLYTPYASNSEYLKDAFRDKVYTSSLDVLLSEAIDIKSLLAGLEKDPEKRTVLLSQLVQNLVSMNQQAAIVSNFGRLPAVNTNVGGEVFTPPRGVENE